MEENFQMATNNGGNGHADVLVVGAGASGSVATKELAEAGFSVVCLEQGGWTSASDYPGNKPEYELLAQKKWHPNPNVRERGEDYPCDTSDSDVNPLMWSGVGGSTILYAAHWARMLPSDFRARSLDGVADDWPFTYEDLLPYYQACERQMGVSGLGGDPAFPDGAEMPNPAFPIHKMGRKAAEGMNKLGWHWWPAPNAMPSNGAYDGLAQCARRGVCLTGCPQGAKASTDLTHWPGAQKAGARLVTGARVRKIETDDQGLATGAIYIDRDGNEQRQTADVVIICATGVGTPRLLLMSADERNPDGLANSTGLVGKRLMMHPYAAVIGIYDDPLESWMGPSGQTIHTYEFFESDPSRGFARGTKWQVMPTGGPMGMRSGYGGAPLEDRFGEALHRNVKEQLGHGFEWGIIAEDLPEQTNYVTLDGQLTDSDGLPAPKIVYRNSENTKAMIDFNLERAKEAHEAAGAKKLMVTPLMRDCGWHLMGTAVMGEDPATSVVDGYGRSHDVPNLYIYDGSVFPSSSGSNPTATICAVALRSVEHLIKNRKNQEVPA
jgi:choline dehydrogenase-like flavoprotein